MNNYKAVLKSKMGKERYHHSICVAKEAKNLAMHYGKDVQKAELAGLLHDITKEFSKEEHLALINKYKINLSKIEQYTPKLWHAITGPLYLRYELNVKDQDVLDAVRYHTTGRKKMEYLEKIVFIADFISEDRFKEFTGVKIARDIAYKDLDDGVLHELNYSITNLVSRESLLSLDTIEAYNYFMILKKEKAINEKAV